MANVKSLFAVPMKTTLLVAANVLYSAITVTAAEPVDYLRDIKPLLAQKCFACHGALKQESGLRLDTALLMRTGGDSGAAITPRRSASSLIIERVTAAEDEGRMPEEADPLSEAEIALLKAWVDQGAVAPSDEKPEEHPRDHWSFQTVQRPQVPVGSNSSRARNPIDRFIAAQHVSHGLKPSPPAGKSVLLRRVYLDLVGLPPLPSELHAFVADESPDAYETVVDRLLESPRYGERWGRHWMDVWRYSDWYGRRRVNDVRNSYAFIWRWRDWILRSLNADKGYDRMVVEMLSADEFAPDDYENVVATGYIVRSWFSMNYDQWKRDLVEHTGKAFLGLRFNCAHCHDHKYDPITQREYFQFRAFFEPLELRHDRVPGEPDPGKFRAYIYPETKNPIKGGLVRVMDEKLDAKTTMYANGDARNQMNDEPPAMPGLPAFFQPDAISIDSIDLPAIAYYPGLRDFIQQEEREKQVTAIETADSELKKAEAAHDSACAALEKLHAAETTPSATVASQDKTAPKTTTEAESKLEAARLAVALQQATVADARAQLESLDARITADNARYKQQADNAEELAQRASQTDRRATLTAAQLELVRLEQSIDKARENARNKAGTSGEAKAQSAIDKAIKQRDDQAKKVEEATVSLESESSEYRPISPVYPKQSTGRRTALARWITDANNPLTARVAVNHIWMRHFGSPLVASVFDFGRSGQKPTHPQLLDWLAAELMEHDWRMKPLHRLIVCCDAYRMQSRSRDADFTNVARDTDNRYLWHFPVQRMQSEVVRDSLLHLSGELDSMLGGPVVDNKLGSDSGRRSLYFSQFPESGGQMKFTNLFDPPNPGDCYRRSDSIVPQQALAMTNSRLLANQSRLLARHITSRLDEQAAQDSDENETFIAALFETVLTRSPSTAETTICHDFLQRQETLFGSKSADELAGQTDERDVPPSAEPAMRARESLVRALLNQNDFVTIR